MKSVIVLSICLMILTISLGVPLAFATNKVLSLDGDGDYVSIPHSSSLNVLGNITVEVWFKMIETNPTDHWLVIDKSHGAIDSKGWVMQGEQTGELRWGSGNDSGFPLVGSKMKLADANWHHAAGVLDGSEMKLYIDGLLNETGSLGGTPVTNIRAINIGAWWGEEEFHRFFTGTIDEVRIWDYARTQEEIQTAMNITLQGNESGLVGYWNFDDGTANDLTINGNNGTLMGDAQIRIAEFTVTPRGGFPPLDVQFIPVTRESSITSYNWDFGDGTTSDEPNPIHTYQDNGLYTVSLTVTADGEVDTITHEDYIISGGFPDPGLDSAVREALNKPEGFITVDELAGLTELEARDRNIRNLTGIQHCVNLERLDLNNNQISDISALSNLTNLTWLELGWNQISDISPLVNLTNLRILLVDGNQITDISSLAELTEIGEFEGDVQVRNGVKVHLGLSNNQISDISPLMNNPGIGEGDGIDLRGNPLSSESIGTLVLELKTRGVKVIAPIIVPDIEGPHALILDGNEDYVKILDSDSLFTNNTFTVEAWFNIHQIENGRWNQVLANDEYEIAVDNTIAVWDNGAGNFWGNTTIQTNTWYHVAFINNGTSRKIFLNGMLDGQSEVSSSLGDINQELWIGNDPAPPSRHFNGLIDEVRIWNVARTQEEIQATMNTTLRGDEPGLVGYWNFDDGTARDFTANGNHGKLQGDAGIIPIVGTFPPTNIGDTSGDGTISAYDASLILQYCVGLIDQFPANIASIGENITPRNRIISIPNLSVKTNELISVPVTIDEPEDLVAGGITIKYDKAVLKATGVKVTPDSLLNNSYWQSNIDNDEIRLAFSKNYLDNEHYKTLAMLEFEAIGSVEGITTDLVIDHAQIAESISIAKVDGHITFLPSKTVLMQNYPNPFNPETWIPFKLADDADIVISIYDISGQLIRKIGLDNIPAGAYTSQDRAVYWNGCNKAGEQVSSGLYFYQLQAGDYRATKRMLILK